MKFTPIDLQTWPRGQMFYYFSKMAPTGYTLLGTNTLAKHGDVVHDLCRITLCVGRNTVLAHDLIILIYKSCGNVGAAQIDTDAIHKSYLV